MGESRNPAVVAGLLSVSALAAPQVAHGLSLGEVVSDVFTNPALSFSAGLVGGAFLTGAIMGGVLLATMNKRETVADHDDKPASAPIASEQKPEVEIKAEVKSEAEDAVEVKSEATPKAPAEVRNEKAGALRHMRAGQPTAEPRDAEEQDARHAHAPSHEAGTYEQIAENYVNKVSFRARMAHRAQGVAATLRERMGANIMDGVPVIERADGTVADLGASWLQQAVGKSEKSMNFIIDTDSFMIPSDFSRTDEERLVERAARAQGISRRVAQIDEGAYPERKNARDLDETDEWIRALNSMDEHIAEQQAASRPASFIDTVGGADTLDEPEGLEPQTSVIPFRTPAGHPEVVDTATYIDYLIEDEISKNLSPSVQRHTRRVLRLLEGGMSSSARLSDISSEYVPKHFAPLMAAQAWFPTPRSDSARRSSLRWAVALCCWIAFIWGHSLIQGPQSSIESGMFVSLVQPVFEALGLTDVNVMSLLVRKCAHFSEYAVLGVIARGLFRALRSEGATHAPIVFLTVLVPVADECLQLFVPGRSGQLTDVLIDLSGLATGALVAHAVAYLVSRRVR